jgi:hypothetical protein
MGKKKYIRPDIREESQILTVSAWVTQTQYVLTTPTASATVALQTAMEAVTETSYALLNVVTSTNVAMQSVITKVNYALQNVFERLASRN